MRSLLLALMLAGPARAQQLPEPVAISAPHPTLADQLEAEKRAEVRRQARVQLARVCASEKDILGWGKALFPDKFELPFCQEMHGYFVDIRGAEFTNTEAPRNHAKTTIKCFLIPLFQALEEPTSFRHYLNVQATSEKSVEINRTIKLELEQNEELREIYGDQVGTELWTEKKFRLANGVIFTGIGAGQSIRGLNYRSIRPDYIVIDDLYDEDDINNPVSTEKKNSWFWGSLYKARAQSRRCSMHLQGTAINSVDLLEQLKDKKRWTSKTFRAIKDYDTKEVLWRELNTFDQLLAEIDDMPTVIFNREMQNERKDDSESLIKTAWLAKWEYEPSDLVFNDHHILVSTELGVDPSIGATETSDYTGIALVLKTRYADAKPGIFNYYIEGLWNRHLSLNERIELLIEIKANADRHINRAHIEGIAGFMDFAGEAKRKTDIPVNLVKQVKDKLTNLENKSGYFQNGRVFISKRIDPKLRKLLAYQLTNNHPNHDDARDAVLLVLPDLKARQSLRPLGQEPA